MPWNGFRRSVHKRRLLLAIAGFAALAAMTGVWFVPTASAHNSLVSVSLACTGTASYTATAWAGPTTASRTNTDVRVYQLVGSTWVQVGQGQFNPGDGFSFAGQFSAGSTSKVDVKVQEVANWGDGVKPGPPGLATASRPSNCGSVPPVSPPPATTTTRTPPPPPPPTTTTTTAPPPPVTTTATPPPVVTVPAPAPAIAIVKTERIGSTGGYTRGPIHAGTGQTIDYQLVVTNIGNVSLAVTLVDPRCDAGTLLPKGSVTLAAGASATYTCTRRLHASDASPWVNTATATGVTVSGSSVGPVSSTVVARPATHVAAATKTLSAKVAKVKKVTAKAKPAKPVAKGAQFTG